MSNKQNIKEIISSRCFSIISLIGPFRFFLIISLIGISVCELSIIWIAGTVIAAYYGVYIPDSVILISNIAANTAIIGDVVFLICLALGLAFSSPDEKDSSSYDNISVDSIPAEALSEKREKK